jgi:hypothetical protein
MRYQGQLVSVPPLPKLEKPALYLGAHGELFSYATLERGDLVYTMTEVSIPPGMGPPAHLHHFVSEWFLAPEGGITIFAAADDHLDVKNHPSREFGTQKTVYLIPLEPGQVICSPRHRVHGYVNTDKVARPLTCFWKPHEDAPKFEPYNDGGTREFFEAVHLKVIDPKDLTNLTEKRRAHYIAESPKYAAPHSSYLFQFINNVSDKIPESLQNNENMEVLDQMVDLLKDYHAGHKDIIVH